MAKSPSAHTSAHQKPFSAAPSLDAKSFLGFSAQQCFCPDWVQKDQWGYPIVTNGKGGKSRGHRMAYRLLVGSIPPGAMVLHRCGNETCINPYHLYLGDAQQNARDRDLHGTTKTAARLPQTKLSDEDVLAIRASGESCIQLAKRYGMSRSYIWCIRAGVVRKNLKAEG